METLRPRYLLAGVLMTGGGMKIEEEGFNKSTLQSVETEDCPSEQADARELSAGKPWRSSPFPPSGCGSPTRTGPV